MMNKYFHKLNDLMSLKYNDDCQKCWLVLLFTAQLDEGVKELNITPTTIAFYKIFPYNSEDKR